MVPKDLSKIKEEDYEIFESGEYLRKVIRDGKKTVLPTKKEDGDKSYKVIKEMNSKIGREVEWLVYDLVNNATEIDAYMSSIYPEEYKKYREDDAKSSKNKTAEEQEKREMAYLDDKRFLLLLYKEFNNKVEKGIKDTETNTEYNNIIKEKLKNIYTYGSKENELIDTAFKEEIKKAFEGINTQNAIVFATGVKGKNPKFHSYTYNEIMNNKSRKNRYLEDFSPEEKDFIAKRLFPIDIETMSEYGECGYKAMSNIDLKSSGFVPTMSKEEIKRFSWIPEKEGYETYKIGPDSVIREEIRNILDDPNYTTYLDNRKFDMVVLYRTLDFLKERARITEYEPKDIVNFVMKMKDKVNKDNIDEKDKNSIINVYAAIGDEKFTFKSLAINYKNLDKYYNLELSKYVDEMIYKNPEYFKEILEETNYKFSEKELTTFITITPDNPEKLLYDYYKKGGITEKELLKLVNEDEYLNKDSLISTILRTEKPNIKIQNIQKIFKEYGIDTKNVSEFLKRAYLCGYLTISEVNKYRDEVFAKIPNIDAEKLGVDAKKLTEEFLIVNKPQIYIDLKNNEGFTKEELEDWFKDIPALAREYSKEEFEQIVMDYQYNRALFLSNGMQENQKTLYEMEKTLDNLVYSKSVLKLLYAEGLILKETGIELGGQDFLDEIEKQEKQYVNENEKVEKNNNSEKIANNENIIINDENSKKTDDKNKSRDYYKEQEVELEELFKRTTKNSKKLSRYGAKEFIEKYQGIKESLPQEEQEKFEKNFNEFQNEFITNNNKLYKDSLIALGKSQILTNEALLQIAQKENYMDVIGTLVADENAIGIDTLKYIFNDKFEKDQGYEEKHQKRNLLEKLFKTNYFTQDDRFAILTSIYGYHSENTSELQKGFDNDNFQFFIDNNYLMLDEVNEKSQSESFTKKNKKEKDQVIKSKNEQLKYPFLDRIDAYHQIDGNVAVTRTVNAWIYLSHKFNKVAIETIGTKKNGVIQNDITNHATYIMDLKTFEEMKSIFIENEGERNVLNFGDVISYFRTNKENPELSRICHTKHWKERLKEQIAGKENLKKDNTSNKSNKNNNSDNNKNIKTNTNKENNVQQEQDEKE